VQLSILIIASDRGAAKASADPLIAAGHGATIRTSAAELSAAASGYSLVVIDRIAPPGSAVETIALVRAATETAPLPILAVAQASGIDEQISLLEAGADEVITRPFTAVELQARIEAMTLSLASATGAHSGHRIGDPTGKRVVAVFSPKGGVGTTTIATNLALLAAQRHQNRTVLLDLDLSYGQVSSHLNLQPRQTLYDLARDEQALHDPDLLRTYTIHLSTGLHVLAAPPSPALASTIGPEQIELVVARALEAYDVVVIDSGTSMDNRHTGVHGRADTVLIPVVPEIPALNAVRLLLDQLSETGQLGSQTLFVLNNTFARDLLRRTDVEAALGTKIATDLPYDPIAYLKAVNEGVPVVFSAPKSAPAEQLRVLADLVFGKEPDKEKASVPGATPAKKEKRGLFGRR
jgi:pilus assembly protein CpaE